jgi:hypothetical protein
MAVTNVSVFRYTDGGMTQAGATTGRMSGTAGDRIGLLNLLLLTGYNWQELTPSNLTQTGNVATINQAAHGFNIDQRLWIVGMDQQGYLNGLTYGDAVYPLSVADTSHLTFTVTGSPTSPATAGGSSTCNGAISSTTATSITMASGASFPNFPYVIKIDSEYMLVTAGFQTATPTVRRGMFGSTAATHTNTTAITQKIMMGVAPAGGATPWTADFTTTNKSTYRPPAGNRMYLDVDDTNTTYALLRGYETMTANGAGTGLFPTVPQVAAGSTYFTSSSAASTAARPWAATASDRMLIVWTDPANAIANQSSAGGMIFSDLIDQTKSGDVYATLLQHGTSAIASNEPILGSAGAAAPGVYIPRSYTQIGSAINCGKLCSDGRTAQTYSGGSNGMTYPHPPDGGLYIAKNSVVEGSVAISRGNLPGIWFVMQQKPGQSFDTVNGTGSYSGKKFILLCTYAGQIALEISNTIQAA